jgi:hypothetical protein
LAKILSPQPYTSRIPVCRRRDRHKTVTVDLPCHGRCGAEPVRSIERSEMTVYGAMEPFLAVPRRRGALTAFHG